MAATPFVELVIGLVTEGRSPDEISSIQAPAEATQRVEDLVAKEHPGTISAEEKAELDSHLQFNHLVILPKARAIELSQRLAVKAKHESDS